MTKPFALKQLVETCGRIIAEHRRS
jgi:hypothetical protein